MSTNANYNFETNIGGLKGPSLTISKLTVIEPSTITIWVYQIRLLFETNNNTDDEGKSILKLTIDPKHHHTFETSKTNETILDALIQAALPANAFYKYESWLKCCKSAEYKSFNEYLKKSWKI